MRLRRQGIWVALAAFLGLYVVRANANAESFWGAGEHYTRIGHTRYLLLLPPHYSPNKRYPLWVNLHGSPGCASHAIYQYREAAQQREAFLLAPQGNGWSAHSYTRPDGAIDLYRAWDMRKDRDRILAVIDEVKSGFSIDTKRVGLMGFSSGCEMGWRLLSERPSEFCFYGGVANGFKDGKPPGGLSGLREAAKHTAHFYAVGKADGFAGPMYKRTTRELQDIGFKPRTVNPDGVGHDLPPSIKEPLLAYLDEVMAHISASEPKPTRTPDPKNVVNIRDRTGQRNREIFMAAMMAVLAAFGYKLVASRRKRAV